MTEATPETIAAAAHALRTEFRARLTVHADAIARTLQREFQMVAWDREQLIGQVQQLLDSAGERRFRRFGGGNVRIVERAAQPLESLELVWTSLQAGRRVQLEWEHGSCSAVRELLRPVSRSLRSITQSPALRVASAPWSASAEEPGASLAAFKVAEEHPSAPDMWPVIGVTPPGPRVAIVESEADPELSAYVLARTSLRRCGADPRSVRHAYVVNPDERLLRHLKRVWVGAVMGPADDPFSFAGPVDKRTRDSFLEAQRVWSNESNVEVLVAGGDLARAGASGHFLAPSLLACDPPAPDLPVVGPMMVVVRSSVGDTRAIAEQVSRVSGQVIVLGASSRGYAGNVRYVRGALLVERLPPGLPDPRPV